MLVMGLSALVVIRVFRLDSWVVTLGCDRWVSSLVWILDRNYCLVRLVWWWLRRLRVWCYLVRVCTLL